MAEVTWLGDEDPSAQVIEQYGYRFVKGEAVKVPDTDPSIGKFRHSPAFSTEKGAEPVESKEPTPPDPEDGSERAAVKNELDRLHIKYDGRAKLETLRELLAKG